MSETMEQFGNCESCGKPICEDDEYHAAADGPYLCKDCTPMLSDAIRQHEEMLSSVPWNPGGLPYETRDEMRSALREMRMEMASSGDRRLLVGGAS